MHAADPVPDPPDVGALYVALREPLLAYIRKQIRDEDAAHDVLHDVFLRIHARPDCLRDVECIDVWIRVIARNAIVDRLRRQRPTTDLCNDVPAPVEASACEVLHDLSLTVPRCLEYLPEPYREALRLTALEGLSQAELGRRLGLSASGAKSRVQRARRLLADLYHACCHLEFDARGSLVAFSPRADPWTTCRLVSAPGAPAGRPEDPD